MHEKIKILMKNPSKYKITESSLSFCIQKEEATKNLKFQQNTGNM